MEKPVVVHKVTDPDLLRHVFAIRKKVFVDEQHCRPELEYADEDVSHHFLAFYGGAPAGAARWRRTDKGIKLERFAVLKEFRGFGIGAELVRTILADISTENGTVYLYAQISAEKFYEPFGFRSEGEPFEQAGIMHRQMKLVSRV